MNNIYIAVVSHNHFDLIKSLGCIDKLSQLKNVKIVIKTNTNESKNIFKQRENIFIIDEPSYLGFGNNNNIIFDYCCSNLNMINTDYFVILNPDVIINNDNLISLIRKLKEDRVKLAAINLFKDENYTIFDNSIREFPTLKTFVKSFLGKGNDSIYDKSKINSIKKIDWAAGSFLAFEVSHYNKLKGFDTRYFMYCEDIDICYRSMLLGVKVTYYPDIKALHLAKHANRKIFSKHFLWHLSSAIRFLRVQYEKKV
ncbi:TPA: glycosyltransferase family 2 protein [Photobacterium damselae]